MNFYCLLSFDISFSWSWSLISEPGLCCGHRALQHLKQQTLWTEPLQQTLHYSLHTANYTYHTAHSIQNIKNVKPTFAHSTLQHRLSTTNNLLYTAHYWTLYIYISQLRLHTAQVWASNAVLVIKSQSTQTQFWQSNAAVTWMYIYAIAGFVILCYWSV